MANVIVGKGSPAQLSTSMHADGDLHSGAKGATTGANANRGRAAKGFARELANLWGLGCATVLAVMVTSGLDERRVHMLNVYYQAPVVATLACLLWARNLRTWHKLRLSPSPLVCFGIEQNESVTSEHVYRLSYACALSLLTSMVLFLYTYDVDEPFVATSILSATYAVPTVVAMWPNRRKGLGQLRMYLRRLVYNCFTPIVRPVAFADFFFADILCSLAKSMSDLERVVCSFGHGIALIHTSAGKCGDRNWKIPAVLLIPSIIRLLQCLRQFSDTREVKCLYNALKYMSAFPVIIISGVRHSIDHDDWIFFWRPLWIGFCVFNTCFSFYWDIKHDWALSLFDAPTRRHADKAPLGLRERRIYGSPSVYYRAILVNFLLRISWTYKLASHLRHHSAVLWLVTAAEITRRFQWSLFRVEVEYLRRVHQTT